MEFVIGIITGVVLVVAGHIAYTFIFHGKDDERISSLKQSITEKEETIAGLQEQVVNYDMELKKIRLKIAEVDNETINYSRDDLIDELRSRLR